MNKRYLVLLIAFILAGTVAQAQINQADKLFKSYSYSLAIPQYLKIAQKPGDPDRNYAIVRLADCYRLINDQLNAKAWYAKAVKLPNSESINWFYYGRALQSAQEYDKAKMAFEKYDYLNPDDSRGKSYAAFCDQVLSLEDKPANFEIKHFNSINSPQSDFGPAFFGDGIVFVSDRRQNFLESKKYEWTNSNYLDMYFATPKYLDEFFQDMNPPKPFSDKFNQTYHDGPATFARHDSLIYLTRATRGKEGKDADNYRTDRLKIFWAAYNGTWSKTEPFFMNSDDYSVGHPSLTPNGDTIYFVSDKPGGFGGTDIYSCVWENGAWSQPVNLGESVNSFGNEMFPAIIGHQLYFASDGFAGFGGLDIFRSTFSDGKWSKAENLGQPINSPFDDFAMVLDSEGKKGFFSSNRPGGLGSDDIYACKRIDTNKKKTNAADQQAVAKNQVPCPPKDTLAVMISGKVKDRMTQKPLQGATVFLLNTQTGKAKVLKTDANGMFKAMGTKGILYVAKGMQNNYIADCLNFKIETTDTARTASIPRDLQIEQLELNKIISVNHLDYSIENIYYDFNKWFIRPDAARELDKLVQVMKENPVTIELGSHTDSRGSKEYNLDLSQKRAESAVRYIVLQGIDASRITAKGYGESQLVNHCSDGVACTAQEHQANRRTEFKVTGFTKTDAGSMYDMDKFKDQEEIPVYLLDQNFFIDCLQDRRIAPASQAKPEASAAPAENKQQPAAKSQAPAKKPVKVSKTENEQKPSAPKSQPVEQQASPRNEKPLNPLTQKPEPAKTEVSSNPGSVQYRVQIYALNHQKSLADPEFEGLQEMQMYVEDGMYKYTTGVFNTHEEALKYRQLMVQAGFSDAFVVTFANNKRIYISPSF